MQYLLRFSDYGLVKHIRLGTTSWQEVTEFQVTRLKVNVIKTHKQIIISYVIAMNVFSVKTSYFIFQQ